MCTGCAVFDQGNKSVSDIACSTVYGFVSLLSEFNDAIPTLMSVHCVCNTQRAKCKLHFNQMRSIERGQMHETEFIWCDWQRWQQNGTRLKRFTEKLNSTPFSEQRFAGNEKRIFSARLFSVLASI